MQETSLNLLENGESAVLFDPAVEAQSQTLPDPSMGDFGCIEDIDEEQLHLDEEHAMGILQSESDLSVRNIELTDLIEKVSIHFSEEQMREKEAAYVQIGEEEASRKSVEEHLSAQQITNFRELKIQLNASATSPYNDEIQVRLESNMASKELSPFTPNVSKRGGDEEVQIEESDEEENPEDSPEVKD
jgi:hypothetical protein